MSAITDECLTSMKTFFTKEHSPAGKRREYAPKETLTQTFVPIRKGSGGGAMG